MNFKPIATALALGLALSTGPAMAADAESAARTASRVLGQLIAEQGNAALVQIREELRQEFREALRPLLPAPATSNVANHGAPAPARTAQR